MSRLNHYEIDRDEWRALRTEYGFPGQAKRQHSEPCAICPTGYTRAGLDLDLYPMLCSGCWHGLTESRRSNLARAWRVRRDKPEQIQRAMMKARAELGARK